MAGQTIQISVLADTKKFSSAMKKLSDESGLTRLGSTLKSVGKAAAIGLGAAGAAAGALAVKGVGLASNLEQSMGGVDAVFKGSADQIHAFAKSAAGNLGLAQNSYNELAAIIGTTLKNSGTPMDALAGKTDDLITVSADLAATFGGPVTDASNAMASALRGEFEPLRKYGVSLSQADIQARALADSGKKSVKELTKQEKAVATQTLILEQSADAQGQFAREANTLAGQQERLKAKFENITTTIGAYLLPVLTKVTTWLSDNLEPAFEKITTWITSKAGPLLSKLSGWFKDNEDKIKTLATQAKDLASKGLEKIAEVGGKVADALKSAGEWIVNNKDWLMALGVTVGTMVAAYQTYIKVMAIWRAAVVLGTALQTAFNAVLAANPIGLIVLAIAGLVAGLTFFFTKTETGQKIWAAFTTALSTGWEAIKSAFSAGYEAVKDWLQKAWDFIKKVWSYTPIGLITSNWDKIIEFFQEVPDKVKGIFEKAIDWLKTAGKNIFTGLKNGATETWNKVWTWIKERPNVIKKRFSTAIDWLKTAGKNVFNGLRNGLTERWATVWGWLKERPTVIKNNWANAIKWLVGAGKNVFNGLRNGLTARWSTVWSWLKERPGKIKDVFSNAGTWLKDAGGKIISGLLDGLRAGFDKVKSTLKNLTSMLPDWKGPAKRDATILKPAGQLLMKGLVSGIDGGVDDVKKTLKAVTDDVERAATFNVNGPDTFAQPRLKPRRVTQTPFAATQAPAASGSSTRAAAAERADNEELVRALVTALAGVRIEIANTVGIDRRTAADITLRGITEAARTDGASLQRALGA